MFDVIVLGGGIMGAATAYALVNQGKNVLLLEQFEAGHKKGSSHGDGRIVRFNYTEGIYVEMAKLGYPAWERLSQAAGQTLLQKTGLLETGAANRPEIAQTEAELKAHNIPYEVLSLDDARQRFPQYHFKEHNRIIYQAEGAIAFATPAVLALWRLFQERGGTALAGIRISKIEASQTQVKLTSATGESWEAGRLVIATGAWSKEMAESLDLDLPLIVTHEILGYFPPSDETVNHHVGTMPIMIDYQDEENPFYCLPIVDVQGVKLGWHHTGAAIQPNDERTIPEAIISRMRQWIGETFPALSTQELEIASCLYTNTPDYHFILDKHPKYENIVIAAGFSGHGFKFGPIIGELLAALVLGNDLPLSLEMFAISRFQKSELERHLGA